mgnify:CR=1 FL=1
MFDDSSVAGGHNSSMLNTSMKSEGGLSVLNTSRGEEVALFVTNIFINSLLKYFQKTSLSGGTFRVGCITFASD